MLPNIILWAIRGGQGLFLALALVLSCLTSTLAQAPLDPTPSPAPAPSETPSVVMETEPESSAPVLVLPSAFRLPLQQEVDDSQAEVRGPLSGRLLMTISGAENFSAQHRARLVVERLRDVARNQGSADVLVSSRVYDQVVVLSAGDTVLATVMPEDTGLTHARAVPAAEMRRLELGVAEQWRAVLQKELAYAAWVQRPEYLKFALPLIGLVLLSAFALHRFLKYLRTRSSLVPAWSLGVLIWTFVSIFVLWMFPSTKFLAWMIKANVLRPFIQISIAYTADLEFALSILEEEANRLATEWSDKILEPPTLKGVQELGNSAVVLRLYFKTLPLRQWDVEREFNQRMKLRLDKEGVEIPFPQTSVWIRKTPTPKE